MKSYKAIFLDWDDTIGDWTTAEHKAAGIDQLWIHQGEADETATYIVPKITDIMTIL